MIKLPEGLGFFKAEDFYSTFPGREYPEANTICFDAAAAANAKLEASFGNEYSIMMFWKKKLEEERAEIERLRGALESIAALSYSWVISELTIDCKHTYDDIRLTARAALEGAA